LQSGPDQIDQTSAYLKQRLAEHRIRPLLPAPPISEQVIESSHIVGMMGTEPIQAAIAAGAEVVLAGRASDSALYAAIPLTLGADPGLSWHAAKTLECGAACAVVPAADCMFASIREDHFDIDRWISTQGARRKPLPRTRCTKMQTRFCSQNPQAS